MLTNTRSNLDCFPNVMREQVVAVLEYAQKNVRTGGMKLLLDACVPRPLRKLLASHTVYTAQEMGWGRLKNGALLRQAEVQFNALISTDQNLKYQQNLVGRKLAIPVLPTNDWLAMLKPGD